MYILEHLKLRLSFSNPDVDVKRGLFIPKQPLWFIITFLQYKLHHIVPITISFHKTSYYMSYRCLAADTYEEKVAVRCLPHAGESRDPCQGGGLKLPLDQTGGSLKPRHE